LLLSWRRLEGGIFHPVLLQRLQLTFDPALPRFTITEAERPPELYSAIFQSMTDVDGRAIGKAMDELEQGNYRPMGDDSTSGFLKKLLIQLSSQGEFVEPGSLGSENDVPRIARRPVFFLRARTLGFAACIEGILEDIRENEDLPLPLLNIVGIETPKEMAAETGVTTTATELEVCDVLLSKQANPEQIRIAQQIDSSAGILVQGPPGTGKTHTIGNLIGHLLANGKSVLVTSHTTKALRMVRSQVVDKLRPLCVSVLESDLDSRKQMESAVGAIAEKLSKANAKSLQIDSDQLSTLRENLLLKLSDLRNKLVKARGDEYRDILIGGKSWTPSDAARFLAAEREKHGWVPEPVVPGAGLPLPVSQILELYATNGSLKPETEQELASALPDPRELLTHGEFEELVSRRDDLASTDRTLREELWESRPHEVTPESLSDLAAKLERAVEPLSGKDRWKLAAVHAGSSGPYREPWDNLVSQIERADAEIAKSQETLLRYSVEIGSDLDLNEQERIALEIHAYLLEGNTLNFLSYLTHSAWKKLAQSAKVNGREPAVAEHFLAINKLARSRNLRRELAARWDRQMVPLGAAPSHSLGREVEKSAVQFCGPIRECLSWSVRTWIPLETELKEAGFLWKKFLDEQPPGVGTDGALQRLQSAVTNILLPILKSRIRRLMWDRNEAKIVALRDKLMIAKATAPHSRVTSELFDAVRSCDREAYHRHYLSLIEISSHAATFHKRKALLATLERMAPGWAAALSHRSGVHGEPVSPGDPVEAWIWRQLHDELEKRASVSLEALQTAIDECSEQVRITTIDLIESRAWAFQTGRTSLSQRQALVGWLDTIRKIGKGMGLRVPRLRSEAAQQMTDCRGAVPVWIMPLSRVVENFNPRKTKFDVVIIDEASQSDVMALVALYLGKKVVVVGDHEQVSPSAVGQEVATVQNLIDQFLLGIPNAHLYDGQTSVYDLARQSFGGTIRLVEHFRCVTEVIQFSNDLSYFGDIKPLRDSSRVVLRPHTVCVRAATGSAKEGKVNRDEAEMIASLISAAVEQPEYQHNEFCERTSFGVVSLVGEDQALEIDRLLHIYLTPEIYDRHGLLCGTPAQFQGDERDVMFLSMVDAPAGGPLPFRDQQMFKQRFNVAASRARDQMWVIHSLNPQTDLKVGDLRRRLIEHAQDPTSLLRVLEGKERRTESPFEREVLGRLVRAGYRVTPQWKVEARRIDLVVEGEKNRLAVECDGDRFHPHEKLGEDMERQAVLERLGWVFARIRGSVYFRDPERAMKGVFEKLKSLEILPSQEFVETSIDPLSYELAERVCRRAEQLRHKWNSDNGKSDLV
jgi:very-short-patch-repair endonuclease